MPKDSEPFEDAVIASLRTKEFKTTLYNAVREMLITLDQIKSENVNYEFIRQSKNKNCEKDQLTSDFSLYETKYCSIVSVSFPQRKGEF